MTIEITPAPAPGSEDARRYGYIAALSTAEHVVSTSPVVPTEVNINCTPWSDGPSLRIYFHDSADDIRAFAEAFSGTVAEEERPDGERLHTSAVGSIAGIPFEAWTLVHVGGAE
ncbi:hypothetical protein ACGFW5_30930 [Streptomyces sp. NPDC048416]|uniref:hypothetical protein n=1 Tax=Streptomyces sp. NPDC048416 TaxID=3365546 RepID=UPI0037239546